MFLPYRPKLRRPQKARKLRQVFFNSPSAPSSGATLLYTLRGGYWAESLAMSLFIKFKKLSRHPLRLARFWLNVPVSIVVTKKPLNNRMGKGKGARAGLRAHLAPNQRLAYFYF